LWTKIAFNATQTIAFPYIQNLFIGSTYKLPVESLKIAVAAEISKHLKEVPATMVKDVPHDIPGDFAFPCFSHAKAAGKKPQEIAEKLAKEMRSEIFEKVEAKDGFVNFFIDCGKAANTLMPEIASQKDSYGRGEKKRKITIEHTSANPNSPLHVGHIRNSILGDTMASILKFAGYDAKPQFFINDMGGQLAILATYLKSIDYEEELKKSKKKPDAWLGDMYVAANKEVNKDVAKALQMNYERGGKEIRKIFDFMVETAVGGFKKTFKDFGITMDDYVRESEFVFGGAVKDVLDKLQKTPYWFEEGGMYAVNLEKYGIKKELVLLRSDGTTLYTTRDLAYHLWKLKSADCINVIANEQTLQQQQLRAGLDLLGVADVEKRVRHLSYELVTIPGMRMSSRTGEFISADDLLKEGIERAKDEIEGRNIEVPESEKDIIAKAVAVGAIRFNMVKITPLKPIEFKWEDALNFEGESAPYLQYSHARACRILEKAKGAKDKVDYSKVELTNEEKKLILLLAEFPQVIQSSASDLKPNTVANYLFTLAEAFNRFYFKCPVIDSPEPLKSARIGLVKSFKQVVGTGLRVLGIEALERM